MYSDVDAEVSKLSRAVLHTAAYADVFDYPLTLEEIHYYLSEVRIPQAVLAEFIDRYSPLHCSEGYYFLPGREALVNTRRDRERAAEKLWPPALRYSRMIAHLPFIRMVAVTGSLAMNNVDGRADIDYLIVTARERLWTGRALVLMVARLASIQGVQLCPNYMVTESALALPGRSLYAAHELAQMVPLYGMETYFRLRELNRWTEAFLPNARGLPPAYRRLSRVEGRSTIQTVLQTVLLTPPGTRFERWEMARKIRRLAREQAESPESCFSAELCKGHLYRHGQRLEHALQKRLESLSLERAP